MAEGAIPGDRPVALAVFDMDKTITARPSWLPWLFYYARTEAPARLLLLPLLAGPLLFYVLGLSDRKRLKEATQCLMLGRSASAERVARAARRFAAEFGARHELSGALAEIARQRAAGRKLVLATASSAYYARYLAERWGFDLLVATENRRAGTRILPAIAGENCYGEGKLRMLLAALPAGHAPASFYSDHESDLPCFLWADEAIAANPSPRLTADARARGWKICRWVSRSGKP